jgi:hypothetical protein
MVPTSRLREIKMKFIFLISLLYEVIEVWVMNTIVKAMRFGFKLQVMYCCIDGGS